MHKNVLVWAQNQFRWQNNGKKLKCLLKKAGKMAIGVKYVIGVR
jgi:hypothetical protein